MKITKIDYLNLEDLFILCCKCQEENEIITNRLNEVLNNMEIDCIIEDVTDFDFFFLKGFCSEIIQLISDDIFEKNTIKCDYITEKDSFIKEKFDDILSLSYSIYDKINIVMSRYLLTSRDIHNTYLCRFTGNALLNIIGISPETFFSKYADESKVFIDDNKFNRAYVNELANDEKLQVEFINIIMRKFYQGMDLYFKSTDKIADNYIKEALNTDSGMVSSRNPLIDLKNATPEKLIAARDEYKEYIKGRTSHLNTTLQFVFETPFCTFIDLYRLLPITRFLFIENLGAVKTKDIVYRELDKNPAIKNYEYRIYSVTTNFFNAFYDDTNASEYFNNVVVYYSFIPNSNSIKFSISLSLKDIDDYIVPELDKFNDKESIELFDEMIYKDLLTIISNDAVDFFKFLNS